MVVRLSEVVVDSVLVTMVVVCVAVGTVWQSAMAVVEAGATATGLDRTLALAE